MKRHPALVSLSQDHHRALVLAQRLRRATDDTLTAEARRFLDHWEAEEKQHFRLEEELVLPAYTEHEAPAQPAILRTLVDHAVIRRDAVELAVAPTLEVLHLLGVRLANHIGFEEQELFPLIESTLTESELCALGERLNDENSAPPNHDSPAETITTRPTLASDQCTRPARSRELAHDADLPVRWPD